MKVKTRSELAKAYGVTVKTLVKRISEFMAIPARRAFWPSEVEKIKEELGDPETK